VLLDDGVVPSFGRTRGAAAGAAMGLLASCAFTTAASDRLRCPDERIAYATLADGSQLVRGCGREALLACYGCRATADLARQAGFELGCPVEGLRYETLDSVSFHPVTVGIWGCGKRAVYQYRGDRWRMDDESTRR
jgi:hypothetical protein